MTPYFFDLLHVDGADLDRLARSPIGSAGWTTCCRPPSCRALSPRTPARPQRLFADAWRPVRRAWWSKALGAPYDAGRRGAAWVKVKPRHTLDLVVLAVEWGSGRRQGWLSNIHLGARDPVDGGFVMLGKTFKGMTDEMLAWQTERFLELEASRDGHVVRLRPEQVVEVAFDGLQTSTRYPGGLALRFARVLRYRTTRPPTRPTPSTPSAASLEWHPISRALPAIASSC